MDGSIPPPSTFPSASTIFRPRRSDDWQKYRSIIEQLYRNDQLKLKDVRRIMERDHNFVASEKQYKDRLAAWHVRKNIKAKEVHIMLRKQQKRATQGKQTAFRVGGQEVDSKRIARFVRRYGASWDKTRNKSKQSSPEPETPSDMSCYTPEPEDRPATLTPYTSVAEMQPTCTRESTYKHDNYDSYDFPTRVPRLPQADDTRPLPTTFNSSLPPETPQNVDGNSAEDDPWEPLTSFQDRLLLLHKTLEQTMSEFNFPRDD